MHRPDVAALVCTWQCRFHFTSKRSFRPIDIPLYLQKKSITKISQKITWWRNTTKD